MNVYQNETVNLILRRHAVKREEHAIPYHHAYNTESEPHFNLIHLIVSDGTTYVDSRDNKM